MEGHNFGGTQIWTQNPGFSSFEPRKPIYSGRMTLIVSQIGQNSFPKKDIPRIWAPSDNF